MKTRTKTRGNVAASLSLSEVATNSGGSYTWIHPVMRTTGSHELMRGSDIPNFHARKAAGEFLPQTDFYQAVETRSGGLIGWSAKGITGTSTEGTTLTASGFGCIPPPVDGWPIVPAADRNRLAQEALVRLYASGFDALTFVAELGSVRRMFQGALRRFSEFASKYSATKAGGLYLEARYGWRPLINDMVLISQLISKISEGSPDQVFKGTSGTESIGTANTATFITFQNNGVTPVVRLEWALSRTINTRFSVYSRIKPPLVRFDPLVTGLELIPLSFVVEWFLAVGSWLLGNIAAGFHSDSQGALGIQTVDTALITAATFVRAGYTGTASASTSIVSVVQERVPSDVAVPKLPGLTFNLDFYKVGDILLIAKQIVTKSLNNSRVRG